MAKADDMMTDALVILAPLVFGNVIAGYTPSVTPLESLDQCYKIRGELLKETPTVRAFCIDLGPDFSPERSQQ